jgi:hypothetical protein
VVYDARMKKRHLAAPFVLTALLSPAFADNTPPTRNPPPQNPPPQTKKLPKAPEGGNVIRHDDGTCWYHEPEHCPPGARCNPPPPHEVECPPPPKKKP